VLDASVWVSRTITTDGNHVAATNWITNHLRAHGTFIAPTLFEVEIAAAISRVTKDKQLAGKEVRQLSRLNARGVIRLVPTNATIIKTATTLAANHGLRAVDAIYAALAQRVGIPLVTFDQELLSLPETVIVTISP
jgi:predicted nucleic acid-binding protein